MLGSLLPRLLASALALLVAVGVTLDRACCLLAEEDAASCCTAEEPIDRVEAPPCCDDEAPAPLMRVDSGTGSVAFVAAVVVAMAPLGVRELARPSSVRPEGLRLPATVPRFRTTSRFLL